MRPAVALVVAGALVVGSGGGAQAASTTTVTSPTNGSVNVTGSVQVAGTYVAVGPGTVKVTLCKRTTTVPSGCRWVNSPTAGTTTTGTFAFNASTSTGNQFTLAFSGLAGGSYEFRTYVVDRTTGYSGGPRSITAFSVQTVPASGRFSIAFGRSMWEVVDNPAPGSCLSLPGTPTLEDAAVALASRGLYAITGVVTNRPSVDPAVRKCDYYSTDANWADLANLRDNYGWRTVSHSKTYRDMTTLSAAQQTDEACGSRGVLEGRGHQDGWGLFNFPNDKQDAASRAVVLSCFAFYRLYGSGVNELSSVLPARELSVESVDGGKCNNPALACYAAPNIGGKRYELPSDLAARVLQPAAGQYNLLQFYRFVDGQRGTLSDLAAWDCTSADPRDHWVSRIEFYCWNDFLAVLDSRSPLATVTHPALVARELGLAP
jgi:hypothetical protein